MKRFFTHKVVDKDCREIEDEYLFYGTEDECLEWITQHGFGYIIVGLTKNDIQQMRKNNKLCFFQK